MIRKVLLGLAVGSCTLFMAACSSSEGASSGLRSWIKNMVDDDNDRIVASKKVEEKQVAAKPFSELYVTCGVDVHVTVVPSQDTPEVMIVASDNLMGYIDVEFDHDMCKIAMNDNCSYMVPSGVDVPKVLIRTCGVKEYYSIGSGDIYVSGQEQLDGELNICLSGSGDFNGEKFRGTAQKVDLVLNGAGDIEIAELNASKTDVQIMGSGDVEIGSLDAKSVTMLVTGSGDIQVAGKADEVSYQIFGSGDISASGLKARSGNAIVYGSGDITCNVLNLTRQENGSGDITNHRK